MSDPFLLAHQTFTAGILARPAVKRLIRGNWEDFLTARGGRLPDKLSESDYPLLHIGPSGGEMNLNFTSNIAEFVLGFDVQVIAGDGVVFGRTLYPTLFAVLCACMDLQRNPASELRLLEWEGTRYVGDLRINSQTLGLATSNDQPSGIYGTKSVCKAELSLWLPQTAMLTYAQT